MHAKAIAEKIQNPIRFYEVATGALTIDEFLEQMTDDSCVRWVVNKTPAQYLGMEYAEYKPTSTAMDPQGLDIARMWRLYHSMALFNTALACTWDEEIVYAAVIKRKKQRRTTLQFG